MHIKTLLILSIFGFAPLFGSDAGPVPSQSHLSLDEFYDEGSQEGSDSDTERAIFSSGLLADAPIQYQPESERALCEAILDLDIEKIKKIAPTVKFSSLDEERTYMSPLCTAAGMKYQYMHGQAAPLPCDAAKIIEMIEILRAAGAQINEECYIPEVQDNYKPLDCALGDGLPEVVEYLLQHGAEIYSHHFLRVMQDNDYSISDAENDQIKLRKLALLLKYGADINDEIFSIQQATPLMIAIGSARPALVRFLVDHGARVTATNIWGHNALVCALREPKTNPETVRFLLDEGADYTQKDHKGRNAYHWAMHAKKSATLLDLLNSHKKACMSMVAQCTAQLSDNESRMLEAPLTDEENARMKREGGAKCPAFARVLVAQYLFGPMVKHHAAAPLPQQKKLSLKSLFYKD